MTNIPRVAVFRDDGHGWRWAGIQDLADPTPGWTPFGGLNGAHYGPLLEGTISARYPMYPYEPP
jgi:hypothetical protein